MKLVILIVICFAVVKSTTTKSSETTCENVYDKCRNASVHNDKLGGWLYKGYGDLFGRDLCVDVFRACKGPLNQ